MIEAEIFCLFNLEVIGRKLKIKYCTVPCGTKEFIQTISTKLEKSFIYFKYIQTPEQDANWQVGQRLKNILSVKNVSFFH